MRVMRALGLIVPATIAAASVGCALLLDYGLSDNYGQSGDASQDDRVSGDAGGSGDDGSTTAEDGGGTVDGAGGGDAPSTVDAGRDAEAGPPFALDCDATVLCDGFEGKTVPESSPVVGVWNDNQLAAGTASVSTVMPASGARSLSLASPQNNTGSSALLLLGSQGITLGTGNVVTTDFDVWLDYVLNDFSGTEQRNILGIRPFSPEPEGTREIAGIYVNRTSGVYGAVRTYSGTTVLTDRTVALDNELRGGWHHVQLEIFFTMGATGYLKITVDGQPKSITGLRTQAGALNAQKFTYWIASDASPGAPALTARFDNVHVRTR